MKETTVLMRGPRNGNGRRLFALLLLDDGAPSGGFRDGDRIDVVEAQALLADPEWVASIVDARRGHPRLDATPKRLDDQH